MEASEVGFSDAVIRRTALVPYQAGRCRDDSQVTRAPIQIILALDALPARICQMVGQNGQTVIRGGQEEIGSANIAIWRYSISSGRRLLGLGNAASSVASWASERTISAAARFSRTCATELAFGMAMRPSRRNVHESAT